MKVHESQTRRGEKFNPTYNKVSEVINFSPGVKNDGFVLKGPNFFSKVFIFL